MYTLSSEMHLFSVFEKQKVVPVISPLRERAYTIRRPIIAGLEAESNMQKAIQGKLMRKLRYPILIQNHMHTQI